jgi:hypothetical protein
MRRWGIDSISLNPDTVLKTTAAILRKEQALRQKDAHEFEPAIVGLRH